MASTLPETASIQMLGWKEWIGLPELGIHFIDAGLNTSTATSRLHVSFVESFRRAGKEQVRFGVQQGDGSNRIARICEAGLVEWRVITGPDGAALRRCVIATDAILGSIRHRIELMLTGEHGGEFPMVLGRDAVPEGCLVSPEATYLAGKPRPF